MRSVSVQWRFGTSSCVDCYCCGAGVELLGSESHRSGLGPVHMAGEMLVIAFKYDAVSDTFAAGYRRWGLALGVNPGRAGYHISLEVFRHQDNYYNIVLSQAERCSSGRRCGASPSAAITTVSFIYGILYLRPIHPIYYITKQRIGFVV
jgi:hypothetical protein